MDLNMKVLVVDNFSTMRRIVKNILKRMGFKHIIEAKHGTAALEELRKEEIGLILAGWSLHKMTGLDLLKTVRSDRKLNHIPFIMVTAEGKKENIIDAVKAGASNYVVMPFAPETLTDKIKKVFKE